MGCDVEGTSRGGGLEEWPGVVPEVVVNDPVKERVGGDEHATVWPHRTER
jgi:hypothetical protein